LESPLQGRGLRKTGRHPNKQPGGKIFKVRGSEKKSRREKHNGGWIGGLSTGGTLIIRKKSVAVTGGSLGPKEKPRQRFLTSKNRSEGRGMQNEK